MALDLGIFVVKLDEQWVCRLITANSRHDQGTPRRTSTQKAYPWSSVCECLAPKPPSNFAYNSNSSNCKMNTTFNFAEYRKVNNFQGCGLGLDVSVSRRVSRRTNVSSRSRLGQNPQRLGLVSVSDLSCVSGLVSVSTQYVSFRVSGHFVSSRRFVQVRAVHSCS